MMIETDREWLEVDGLGGFASATTTGLRTRRYHALLLTAEEDGTRFVLVNGLEATLETERGSWALSTQQYGGGIIHPEGYRSVESFSAEPWPRWIYRLLDGTGVEMEIVARHGHPQVFLSWRLLGKPPADVRLTVRPLLSGRDYHSLHHENPAFRFQPEVTGNVLTVRPYDGVPSVVVASNGEYHHEPCWYRRFHWVVTPRIGKPVEIPCIFCGGDRNADPSQT